jgi:hypothetical protein
MKPLLVSRFGPAARLVVIGAFFLTGLAAAGCTSSKEGANASRADSGSDATWADWYRPVENPVFTTEHGNNHDPILFVDQRLEYPYHLIVSHRGDGTDLWRASDFSWSSADWELLDDDYDIDNRYEYDDGVKVDGTYYLFEGGRVYTYDGSLEEADGQWRNAGTFPSDEAADVGVFYEDGVFHLFGEHGDFAHGYDGTELAHLTSTTGLGDWTLVDDDAVEPNPDGSGRYGVGDATIEKIDGTYYLFCDRETEEKPYRVTAWRTEDLGEPFTFMQVVAAPRADRTDDWDNQRIQDADIGYVEELSRYVMFVNMRDTDGRPGGAFPSLADGVSRVVGTFYSENTLRKRK